MAKATLHFHVRSNYGTPPHLAPEKIFGGKIPQRIGSSTKFSPKTKRNMELPFWDVWIRTRIGSATDAEVVSKRPVMAGVLRRVPAWLVDLARGIAYVYAARSEMRARQHNYRHAGN